MLQEFLQYLATVIRVSQLTEQNNRHAVIFFYKFLDETEEEF